MPLGLSSHLVLLGFSDDFSLYYLVDFGLSCGDGFGYLAGGLGGGVEGWFLNFELSGFLDEEEFLDLVGDGSWRALWFVVD